MRILWVCKSCKWKTRCIFFRILETEMRDYISVGESLFHKLLSVHSCIFMSELYFYYFILHSAESSGTLILTEIPVNSVKCGLCVIINYSQTCARQAAFWQQANMLAAGWRPLNVFCLWSLHDPSLTESWKSSQKEHKKPLKKSNSKHKFTGRLAKCARWLKRTIA